MDESLKRKTESKVLALQGLTGTAYIVFVRSDMLFERKTTCYSDRIAKRMKRKLARDRTLRGAASAQDSVVARRLLAAGK